ncbi:MAG: carbohydrate kinase family protein [Bacteroidota bacterium]|nr:carbohydrate kinase family protein [Bacteroidota bacterium]
MKFTVLGHCSFDMLHHVGGREERKPGGIFLAVKALASFCGGEDSVQPVFGVGREDIDAVKDQLSSYAAVDTSGIFLLEGKTNEVHFYAQPCEGSEPSQGLVKFTECSKSIAPPIPFLRIEPRLSTNGILLNMISGSDITLETLDQIRLAIRERGIPLHLDLHNLTLGVNADFSRFRRPLSDWRRWCFMADSVQMNEEEAAGLTMERYDEEMLAKQMLPLMVKGMCVTRGARGATVFRQDHKQILRNDAAGDPFFSRTAIGSGDVFGAAFLFSVCKKRKMTDALVFAHHAAHEFAVEGEPAFGGFQKLAAAVSPVAPFSL